MMKISTKKIKEVSLRQHDSTDCGAACLASVIRYFGGDAKIEMIRSLSGTSQAGTTMLGLCQAAKEYGMEAVGYEASVKDIICHEGVLILHITQQNKYEHYVVSYGCAGNKFVLWDPASGLECKSIKEIEDIWLSRKCLAVTPGRNFVYRKTERKEKREWILETIMPDKELLAESVFLGLVIAVLGIVMAVFTQKLLDKIIPSGKLQLLITASTLVFLLLATRVILNTVRQYILLYQGKNYNIRIMDKFFNSMLMLPKPFFDNRKTGDMVARLNDTMRIQRVISEIASTYIIDVLITVIMMGMIFRYSSIAGFISILATPLFFMVVYRWNKPVITSQYDMMAGYALNESNFINTLKGITEIKCMRWQTIYAGRSKAIFSSFQEKSYSLGRIKIKLGMIINLSGTFYLMVLLVYASFEVMKSGMTQGELMAVLSLSSALLPSVMNLALVSVPLNEVKVAVERMFEFTRLHPESCEDTGVSSNLKINKIVLEDISFRFPGQKLLLSSVNLEIEKGGMAALVGDSGSGKSTLVNIMMQFYHPENGRIIVNDLNDSGMITLEQWRKSVGLVPQDVHVFNGTVLENIIPDPDEKKLRRLIDMISGCGLEYFINGLPLGLATLIGEDGVKLSGGQKQVIAFMRALYNEPDILLVDEGTSWMDRDTERVIMDILKRLKSKIGILLVSHRINLIRQMCDRIYILEGGRISDMGTHDYLMTGNNIYRRFWDDFR